MATLLVWIMSVSFFVNKNAQRKRVSFIQFADLQLQLTNRAAVRPTTVSWRLELELEVVVQGDLAEASGDRLNVAARPPLSRRPSNRNWPHCPRTRSPTVTNCRADSNSLRPALIRPASRLDQPPAHHCRPRSTVTNPHHQPHRHLRTVDLRWHCLHLRLLRS